MKVLIIDDEPSIRDTFQWYLEDLGYDVVTAETPENCAVYHGHNCSQEFACGDAVIIDYSMPRMNGLDFVEKLSARGCKGVVSNMLIISGNTSEIDLEKASQLGCTVMQKPVTFDTLMAWLETIEKKDSHCPQNSSIVLVKVP